MIFQWYSRVINFIMNYLQTCFFIIWIWDLEFIQLCIVYINFITYMIHITITIINKIIINTIIEIQNYTVEFAISLK